MAKIYYAWWHEKNFSPDDFTSLTPAEEVEETINFVKTWIEKNKKGFAFDRSLYDTKTLSEKYQDEARRKLEERSQGKKIVRNMKNGII